MDDVKDGDGVERLFPKAELVKVYKRLKRGDETAMEPWCQYFAKLGSYSAGKCANQAYGIWHENLYHERYHAAWGLAADIGRDVKEGKIKIRGCPENYVWAAIRYKMIADDVGDRGDGSTKSKEGWQAKRWKFTEIEIPVLTHATTRLWEELMACCEDDFERDVVRLFAENGNDPEKVAKLAEVGIQELQRCRGLIAQRFAKRKRDQGEPSPVFEQRAKSLRGYRERPKQSNDWPKDTPQVKAKKVVK